MAEIKRSRACCVACSGESEIPRLLRERLEQVRLREDIEKGGKEDEQQVGGEVDLLACGNQVLITVNAPSSFQLSLDFLPCFRPPEPNKHHSQGGWIAGSSGSLLLCTAGKFYQAEYFICNPLSKQWFALPPVPLVYVRANVGFIFEPCSNSDSQQHQLNCSVCKFMVVRFGHTQVVQSQFIVQTFSSDPGEWTTETVASQKEFRWLSDELSFKSYFHNGCLHWLARRGSLVVYDPYNKKLPGVISGPKRVETCLTSAFGGLGLCNGSFWLCQHAGISHDLRFWKLKGYGSVDDIDNCSWSLQYLFNFKEMTSSPISMPNLRCGTMLAMHPYDPDIAYLQLGSRKSVNQYVVSCNLRTKTKGQAWFEIPEYRFWGDVLTLFLPNRPCLG